MKNYNEILRSSGPLVLILILGFFVVKFTLAKVGEQSVQIKKLEKDNTTLTQKIRILSAAGLDSENDANLVTIVLPESNSSLVVVSQLRLKALEMSLLVDSLKVGAEIKDPSGLSRSDVSFEITGPKPQIIDYLNSLSQIAPIVIVDKVKLSESEGIARASVGVKAFWSALPKTLPSVSESLKDLTEAEYEFLIELDKLQKPQFSSDYIESNEGDGRGNPFAL